MCVCIKIIAIFIRSFKLLSARECVRITNRRAIAMTFIHPFVCPSVCLSGTGVHCDHTVHFSGDLSLLLDSAMLWTP